jgi:hypothetical protein
MTWPHFLQRTFTPLAPTLSSLIMYWAWQLSQTKRIGLGRKRRGMAQTCSAIQRKGRRL